MSKQLDASRLAELVGEAEAAVASVKDPELKRVAFEKILESLLGPAATSSKKPQGKSRKRPKSTPRSREPAARKKSTRKGPKARIAELIDDGFFAKQRTLADVKAELVNRGHHIPMTSLSGPLQRFTQERRLRRQKRNGGTTKGTYVYSNW